ncbi:unnamed protein product [Allacma fusca]|uniref:Uncharacterized protein n=1 Tax=Allacma fusca TaxID=39272 RepID=A0A8J2PBV7_9HEXA|nr:unnamed protein product [Allacma fusca]
MFLNSMQIILSFHFAESSGKRAHKQLQLSGLLQSELHNRPIGHHTNPRKHQRFRIADFGSNMTDFEEGVELQIN